MRTIAFIIISSLGLVGGLGACTEVADEPATSTVTAASTASPPDLCDEVNHEPVPRPGGSCTFEVSLDSVTVTAGQGISEGALELNVQASAGTATTSWPGALPAVHDDFVPGTTVPAGKGHVIASFTVPAGQVKKVKTCASFTEVDNGGANGVDDVGSACTQVTMTATAAAGGKVVCSATPAAPTVSATLCGDNQCLGSAAAHFEVMVKDADMDGVENDEDFTPDVCDQAEKGQKGRASLVYFHMGDGPMTTFFQAFATDLSKALAGYDYRVVILDPTYAGPFLVNAQALGQADLVLDPFEDNLYLAMQEITRRGYDMDIWIWSHGAQMTRVGLQRTDIMSLDEDECAPMPDEICGNGLDDDGDALVDEGDCGPVPQGEICWNGSDDDGDGFVDEADGIFDSEIVQHLTPDRIGTTLVPIRMVYSIACFAEGMNWAWDLVGAYVTSGTLGIDFYPVFYGGFADAWSSASTYADAVVLSDKPGDRSLVNTYVDLQSVPWNCDDVSFPNGQEELLEVRALNPCARDFFVDDDGAEVGDDAVYDIGASAYDASLSGQANMDAQSTRIIDGDGTIRKFVPATLSW